MKFHAIPRRNGFGGASLQPGGLGKRESPPCERGLFRENRSQPRKAIPFPIFPPLVPNKRCCLSFSSSLSLSNLEYRPLVPKSELSMTEFNQSSRCSAEGREGWRRVTPRKPRGRPIYTLWHRRRQYLRARGSIQRAILRSCRLALIPSTRRERVRARSPARVTDRL